MTDYEAVIGLEVHVQLKTRSKMFSSAPTGFGEPPNTLTDPVVLGLPGVLPVMNKLAIEKMIQMGLMFGCRIADVCKWDRKNYWYPDSPKNYQISQYDQPLCIGGTVEIELPGSSRNVMGEHRTVQLTRIHLEEDPGKLNHFGDYSLIDDNRNGTALAEIVTDPCISEAEEAVAFLNALRMALTAADVSDCDMEKGQLRCDANVSIRPKGSTEFGIRTEMKNLNSVSQVRAAIQAEIKRQTRLCDEGRKADIVQETRRWDADKGVTYSLRSKEEAHDYRYFPDPDLMPVKVDEDWKNRLREGLPELPFDRQRRYMDDLGIPYTAASVLIGDIALSRFFEDAAEQSGKPTEVANYLANELLRELSAATGEGERPLPVSEAKISPAHVAELVKLVDAGTISKHHGREVFAEMFQSGEMPKAVVERMGLKQSSDTGELEALCQQAIEAQPANAEEFKGGKDGAINPMVGFVMKQTRGKANPQTVREVFTKLLRG